MAVGTIIKEVCGHYFGFTICPLIINRIDMIFTLKEDFQHA